MSRLRLLLLLKDGFLGEADGTAQFGDAQRLAQHFEDVEAFGAGHVDGAGVAGKEDDGELIVTRVAQLLDGVEAEAIGHEVIDEKDVDTDEVGFGSVVHVKDQKTGDSQKFQIVGSTEANPLEHKLSNESPIGKALLGHKRNDVVTVEVPRGPKKKLKITKIETV